MRRLVNSLVILIFVASLSFAQGMMREREGQIGMMGKGVMGMQGGMGPMMGGKFLWKNRLLK
jgi:hypothetical protein